MHALMNTAVQGHVAYRSINDVLSITSHSSNTTVDSRADTIVDEAMPHYPYCKDERSN